MSVLPLETLKTALGEIAVITSAEEKQVFEQEWRGLFHGHCAAVLLPKTTAEASFAIKCLNEAKIPWRPQGGNTGLVGGQTPTQGGEEVIISTKRMRAVRLSDAYSGTLTAEAGLTLQELQQQAEAMGWMFPVSLASEGSCTVGGAISTNAGGTAVIAYGMMRAQVLGLEVVMNDGRLWEGLTALRKDNFGWDLKQLFIGSEGSFGLITAATFRLEPKPASICTAMIGVEHTTHMASLLKAVQTSGIGRLLAFEFIPRSGVEMVMRHQEGTREPLASSHPWYVLLQIGGGRHGLQDDLVDVLAAVAAENLIRDAAIAQSQAEADAWWKLRHALSEAQKFEGGSIKHDVAVPVASLPAFIDEAIEAAKQVVPDARPIPFGHFGDGNVHFNVSQPVAMDKQEFINFWDQMNEAVHAVVLKYQGSIAAEHGVGRLKEPLLHKHKSAVDLDIRSALQKALNGRDFR